MASQTDLLRNLHPELRQCVYSHLFFGPGDRRIHVGQKPQFDGEVSSVLKMPEDPFYLSWRRQKLLRSRNQDWDEEVWVEDVDDAFFQALRWITRERPQVLRRMKIGPRNLSMNDIISEFIHEVTGQDRCRKRESHHLQELRMFSRIRQDMFAQNIPADQAYDFINSRIKDPYLTNEHQTVFIQMLNHFSNRVESPLAQELSSPTLVNHFYRTECIDHLASNARFDFGPCGLDFGPCGQALQRFHSIAPAAMALSLRHVRIGLVEGHMPSLPAWPVLRTLTVELLPRVLMRGDVNDRAWGTQTEELLASLGVTVAVRARISMEMRWADDCERFEREYVGPGRWRRVGADGEDEAPGRGNGFCRRGYELCGNDQTSMGVKEIDKVVASLLETSIF